LLFSLGITAAEHFALTVLLSDDYAQFKTVPPQFYYLLQRIRFFKCIKQLPMELQKRICNILLGSTKTDISTRDFKLALSSMINLLVLKSLPTIKLN